MHRFWLLLIAGLFLVATLYQLSLPGLHYDEAFEVVPAVQLLKGQPVTSFRDSAITLFGKRLPLTTQDYIGALNTYAVLPFLAVRIDVVSLRLYSIAIGLITLLLVYGFTRSLTGSRSAGWVAAGLLAVNPTFIFWSRQGIFVTAITALIGVAAAWCWLAWQRRRDARLAYLGAFLFGLGIYAKLLFVWLIGALFGAFLLKLIVIRCRKQLNWSDLQLSPHQIIGMLISGIFGCWPLILYNLQTSGTFKSIGENATTSYYGVNNADILSNLGVRLGQWGTLLSSGQFWYLGEVHHNRLAPIVFSLMLVTTVGLAYRTGRLASLLPFIVIGITITVSVITVSALWITHYALIMVWPAIAIAAGGQLLFDYFRENRYITTAIGIGLVLLFATEVWTTVADHRALTTSGGLGAHSDAIYDLAAWLEAQPPKPVIAMDWGLAAPVSFLSAGQINPVEVFGYTWQGTEDFNPSIQPYLKPQAAIFLWRAPDEIIFDRSADFKTRYRPLNLEETILEAFYERSGRPVLGATTLVPVGAAENKPVEP
jgi:hypothetical protein